jgi:hypothetical protein
LPRLNSDTSVVELAELLSGIDVVINLAGAPIIARWSNKYKEHLSESRIITTRKLTEAISMMENKAKLLISASAIGIYSQHGIQVEDNYQPAGDFLGNLCINWELEAKKASSVTRVSIIRLGIVLGRRGGALERIIPIFKIGLGGKIASGRQGFSFIHIVDVVRAIQYIIDNQELSGEFNFTAPEMVDNKMFTTLLAGILNRPAIVTVPTFALRLLYGEGSVAVTGGQFAHPKHLLEEGFQFVFPELEGALRDIANS